MTINKELFAGKDLKTLIVLVMIAAPITFAFAQVPTSGTTHHLAMSDVGTAAHLQAGGERRSDGALTLDENGWHAWTVDAVENAPAWCCSTWKKGHARGEACDLDSRYYGFSRPSERAVTEEMQVFVKITDGRAESIRTYGKSCAVNQDAVIDHGKIATATSLSWLGRQVGSSEKLTGSALGSIAVHDSVQAQRLLESSTGASHPLETRKQAIFWMGQARALQSEEALSRLMLTDSVNDIREHAVFSISQSVLPNRLELIEKSARSDTDPKVRGQSWFWLAQTGEVRVAPRILSGMEAESNRYVLKQAVFALSQLPDDDAVNALIRVVEQSGQERGIRKQALFWMAQNDSPRAVEYLAAVLDR